MTEDWENWEDRYLIFDGLTFNALMKVGDHIRTIEIMEKKIDELTKIIKAYVPEGIRKEVYHV